MKDGEQSQLFNEHFIFLRDHFIREISKCSRGDTPVERNLQKVQLSCFSIWELIISYGHPGIITCSTFHPSNKESTVNFNEDIECYCNSTRTMSTCNPDKLIGDYLDHFDS